MSKQKQQQQKPQAPKQAVSDELLISHWDGNKFVKINHAQLFQLCIDDDESLLMDKSSYEDNKKELDALCSKHRMRVEPAGKSQVEFTTKLRTKVARQGTEFVLTLEPWK